MEKRHIVVLTAGLNQPSSSRMLADALAKSTGAALEEDGVEAEFTTVELREHAHAVTDMLLTRFPSAELREVMDQIKVADGVIAVTPIFTAGPSGLFKSFVDLFTTEDFDGKPVLLGATGGSARHTLVLESAIRPLFTYLRADVATTAVFAATDDWSGTDEANPLPERLNRAGAEFARIVSNYTNPGAFDEFAAAPDFLNLLQN
ncbi:MAG TPA: CE1759 family FMN reductase [Actinomycetales bacterium]|nr:CE1759 family FMN reductase [Actinomycetales bacterium]